MNLLDLNGAWQFRALGAGDDAWRPAIVPGCVHTDLLVLGAIPDPFVEDFELDVQWVAQQDWEYRRTFTLEAEPPDDVELVCEGLDTLATIFINDEEVGRADNMHRTWRFDDLWMLNAGANEIVVRFASPVAWCAARAAERPLAQANDNFAGAPYLRKAPYQFGWDWGPNLPTMGIWRSIRLESGARIVDVQIRQQHNPGSVNLDIEVTCEGVDLNAGAPLTARLIGPDGRAWETWDGFHHSDRARVFFDIDDPQLWWPNGLGEPLLYRLDLAMTVGILDDDIEEYDVTHSLEIGLRTIELRQEADAWGRSFTFVVNGVPLFAKGANWIPADPFPSRVDASTYTTLLEAAAAAHMNMIRVWGGGIYESDSFYAECDRLGLLVWHDFMFACSVYPLHDDAFVENVAAEVADNVQRLRHHACIALWCGNNEMESGWWHWGWSHPDTQDLLEADRRFFYTTLRDLLAELDLATPYWPSSPSSGDITLDPQDEHQGDAHRWEVWHALQPFTHYRSQNPRFCSEFGFESLPAPATIATYAPPAAWNMTSYLMEHHQRHPDGNGKIIAYLTRAYRVPKDFDALIYLSQVQQAEAMRYGVEHWRRQWPRTAGALYWQLNDCWPVASWSSIDNALRWKALHHTARRFFAPLLLSVENEGTTMHLWLNQDRPAAWAGRVRWTVETLDGVVQQQGEVAASIQGPAALRLASIDCSTVAVRPLNRALVFVADLLDSDGVLAGRSVTPFLPDKHLELTDPQIAWTRAPAGAGFTLTLTAHALARYVEVTLEGADVIPGDNFFDLPAGRTHTLTLPRPAGWGDAQVRDALRVRSLRDSYL